jgi:hypothetical protein
MYLVNSKDYLLENACRILCFLIPLFFLVLKGFSNTALFFLFLVCFYKILNNYRFFVINRSALFWVCLIGLLLPFLCELFVQIFRGQIVWRSLDAPSRFLCSAIIFVCLSKLRISEHFRAFSLGSLLAVFIVTVTGSLQQDYWWDHGTRFATYFVDPLTVACFTVFLGSIALVGWQWRDEKLNFVSTYLIFICVVYVVAQSASRSAWLPLLLFSILAIFKLRFSVTKKLSSLLLTTLFFLILFIGFYYAGQFERFIRMCEEFKFWFFQNNVDTSVGGRLGLLRLDLFLITLSPYLGWPDGVLPSYDDLKLVLPDLSPQLYELKLYAGSHVEVLQKLVSMGLIFGGISILSIFIMPLLLFWKFSKSQNADLKRMASTGFFVLLGLFLSGLSIQVLNLKMTSSLVSFFNALICSGIVSFRERSSN